MPQGRRSLALVEFSFALEASSDLPLSRSIRILTQARPSKVGSIEPSSYRYMSGC
jgi:hypothetical protein